jgi:KRAB domain-containing zinc finger protein
MKYNDDSVYDEHLNMFLNQSDLEPEVPCVFCNQRFAGPTPLKKHIKLMHGKNELSCPICNRNFKLKNRLDLHLRKTHTKSTYCCRECDFESVHKKEVQNHVTNTHEHTTSNIKELKTCMECNKELKSYKSLIKHITIHHGKGSKIFACVDCGFKAINQKDLKKHNVEVHEKILEKGEQRSCPLCEYQTEWGKSHLDRHIRAIHDRIKDFQCPFCEVSCSQKGNLRLHIDQVHKNIRKYTCNQCDYKSNFKNDVAKHKKSVHEKTKDISCPSCNFTTTLKSYLNIHMKTLHGESRKEHLCTHCGKQFRVFRNLFNHIKVIHPFEQLPENPRKNKKSYLSMKVHSTPTEETKRLSWKERQDLVYKMKQPQKRVVNGKTYHRVSCTESGCDYTTLWGKNHLQKHVKAVHQKVKDIKCNECEYIACQNIHMSTHLKLVHLTCHQCGQRFWENIEEMASCQHCNVRFPLRRHLVRHMKAMHPDKPLPCKVIRVEGKSLRLSNETDFNKEFGPAEENVSKRKRYNENLQKLKKHIHSEHQIIKRDPNVKDQQCPDCDYKTTDKCHLNEHIKAVHRKIKDFLCEQCSYATSRKSNLIKHINKQHLGHPEEKVKMVACPKCSERFAGQEKLNEHVANIHPELKRLSCHLCIFQTKDSSHLKRHIKAIHDKIKDHNCPQCSDTFSDKSNMLKHIKAVHLKLKNVNHKSHLSRATPINLKQNSWQCNNKLKINKSQADPQNYQFVTPLQSNLGEAQPSGLPRTDPNKALTDTEISCSHCRFQTHSQELIEKHINEEHEKVKNLACYHCSYVTWTNYNLERHIKRCHDRKIKDKDLNIKDLQCSQCNYKTALPDRLAKHVKEVHEMTKDISCNFCKYQTKRKSNLDAHMQRVHEKNKKQSKPSNYHEVLSQEIMTSTSPFSVMPTTTTEIITVPVVQQEVQIQSGKWEQPTIVYQQHSYFITDQL